MASKERGGAVDNSAKSAKGSSAGKRVTAPVYNGAQTSAQVAANASSSGSPAISGLSMAQQLYSRIESLNYARGQLADTLTALGLYEPAPAKAEDLAREPHSNVLRIINEELNESISFSNRLLYEAVYGNENVEEAADEDENKSVEPTGPVMKTQYGRTVYYDAQTAILRLLSIQYKANRLGASMVGGDVPEDRRQSDITDSVHACLYNLADHIDDTVAALHRVNADLSTNLLGAVAL